MYDNMCKSIKEEQMYASIDILLDALKSSKNTNNVRLIFELSIIKILETKNVQKIEKVKVETPILDEKKKIKTERKKGNN